MAATSKRSRKRHVQQRLFRRGGKRRGAGRKPNGARAGEGHDARPAFKPYHGLHVVMRVVPEVGSLRRRAMYKAVRDATITATLRERFRIVPRLTCESPSRFVVAVGRGVGTRIVVAIVGAVLAGGLGGAAFFVVRANRRRQRRTAELGRAAVGG